MSRRRLDNRYARRRSRHRLANRSSSGFIGRQRRLRVGDAWYSVDLLFFHRALRCLVVIDLKLGELSHADAGQIRRGTVLAFGPMGDAFLNRASGTFTETSKEWMISGDQWSQTYYQWRDGKLYRVENDNKEQQYAERELDVDAFVREHEAATAAPYAEMVSFLAARPT